MRNKIIKKKSIYKKVSPTILKKLGFLKKFSINTNIRSLEYKQYKALKQSVPPKLNDKKEDKTFANRDKVFSPVDLIKKPKFKRTYIVLTQKDPEWLFAYWEIGNIDVNIIENIVLKVHEGSDIYDIILDKNISSWYFQPKGTAGEIYIELGILDNNNKYIPIVNSNSITYQINISQNINGVELYDSELDETELLNIPEEEIIEIYEETFGDEKILKYIISSESFVKIFKDILSSESFISSNLISSIGGVSSTAIIDKVEQLKYKIEKDDFFLIVETEVIIKGYTKPNATVKLGEFTIPLKEDGSFSLHFALPNGEHKFPIKAISSNKKHIITITPYITKKEE